MTFPPERSIKRSFPATRKKSILEPISAYPCARGIGYDLSDRIIDQEYPGHEESIKGILINLFRKEKRMAPIIRFDKVGKESLAHKTALDVFRGNRGADLIVSVKDVLEVLY